MPVYKRQDTKSNRWYYKFEIAGIVYKRTIPTARTKRQAEEAEVKARQEVHEGKYSPTKQMLFTDFVEKHYLPWAATHHSPNDTDTTQGDLLCEYFKGYTLSQLSPMAIEGFKLKQAKTLTQYGRPFAPGTVNLALSHLSGILSMAVRYNFLTHNPCRLVKRLPAVTKRPRYLLPEEEEILLKECERGPAFLKPLVQFSIWTGFRQMEAVTLTRPQIDFNRGLIFLLKTKWKNDPRKREGFPMSSQVRDLLFSFPESYYLFTHKGQPLHQPQVDACFRRTCRRAGIYDLTFHALRHTFGTRLADRDVNLKKIARLMGHANTKTTEIYVHTTDAGLAEAVEIAAEKAQNRSAPSYNQGVSSLELAG